MNSASTVLLIENQRYPGRYEQAMKSSDPNEWNEAMKDES